MLLILNADSVFIAKSDNFKIFTSNIYVFIVIDQSSNRNLKYHRRYGRPIHVRKIVNFESPK